MQTKEKKQCKWKATEIIVIIVIFFLANISPSQTFIESSSETTFPASGLVAYYSFDQDASDNYGNINLINNNVKMVTGKMGNCFEFNKTNYLGTSTNISFDRGREKYSISVWFYADTVTESSGHIIMDRFAENSYFSYGLEILPDKELRFSSWSSNPFEMRGIYINLKEWHHAVVTVGIVESKLYLDGALKVTKQVTPSETPGSGLTIGGYFGAFGFEKANFFEGKIDEVGIWNKVLSEQDISNLYNDGNGLRFESKPTTTIITHGFALDLSETPDWGKYRWQMAMADAIPNNQIVLIRKGVFYRKKESTNLAIIWASDDIQKVLNADFTTDLNLKSDKNTVLVFDWNEESDIQALGYAEAAANVLAASILKLAGKYPWLVRKLHFIGHSRGTVVNSEAIQRLIYIAGNDKLPVGEIQENFDKNIHMTTLDPHPAGHWTHLVPMNDDHVNSEDITVFDLEKGYDVHTGVSGWKSENGLYKVGYMDNYYHPHGTLNEFFGKAIKFRGLNNIPGLEKNINLETVFDEQDINNGTHSMVHAWYNGTVNLNTAYEEFNDTDSREIRRDNWYTDNLGATEGFYYSREKNPDKMYQISSDTEGLYIVSQDKSFSENSLIFNGDFSLNGDINPYTLSYYVPGWDYQGGGGLGKIAWGSLHLGVGHSERTSNWFYVLGDKLYFSLNVTSVFGGGALVVTVIGDRGDEDSSKIDVGSSFMNKSYYEVDMSKYKNKAVRLKFTTVNKGFGIPEVSIDNVGFIKRDFVEATLVLNNSPGNLSRSSAQDARLYFHAYDEFGNHTGQIDDTTWVTEIPGSKYYVSADSQVTIISLPKGHQYKYSTQSIGFEGKGQLTVDDFSDGKGATSVVFDSVSIGTSTVTQTDLMDVSQDAVLHVDREGDGTFEETVESTYLKNYSITVAKTGNGSVSPEGTTTVLAGSNVDYTIAPADGESIIDVKINGVSQGAISSFSVNDIHQDYNVEVDFTNVTAIGSEKKTYLTRFVLNQNYPNPFNPSTTISFALPKSSKVVVDVYNSLGQEVTRLLENQMPAGEHQVRFDAGDLPTGVYYYRIQAGKFNAVKKMLLIR